MRDDSRHGISTTVIFAEHLTQKAPDGRERVKHSVPKPDAVFVEHIPNAGLGQNVRERKPLIARKTGADRIQARHGTVLPFEGDPSQLMSVHYRRITVRQKS